MQTVRKKNVFLITDKCTLTLWSGLTMMAACASWDSFRLPVRCFGHVQPDLGEAGEIICLGWLGIPPVELVEVSGLPSWSCYPRELVPDRRLEDGQMEVSSFYLLSALSYFWCGSLQKAPPGQLRCAQMENQLKVRVPGLGPYPGARPGKGNIGALPVAGLYWRCLASLIRHGRPHMGPAFAGGTIEDISITKNTLHHMKHISVSMILSKFKHTPSSSS